MSSTIKLLNTTRKVANLKAFDGDTMDLPASIGGEGIEVDAKFAWQLPRGVKNLTKVVEPVQEVVEEKSPIVVPETPATPLKVTGPR